MRDQHRCAFCKEQKYGKPVVISESLPYRVHRTFECPDCGKELDGARNEFQLFGDPVRIAFDPLATSKEKEEGFTIQDIWADNIARTLWLGLGSHYLKDQYFRARQMGVAELFRKDRPLTLDNFRGRLNVGGWGIFNGIDHDIARALYPYVVFELMAENRWPYFVPRGLPRQSLRWVYEPPKQNKFSMEHVMASGIPASARKPPIRTISLED